MQVTDATRVEPKRRAKYLAVPKCAYWLINREMTAGGISERRGIYAASWWLVAPGCVHLEREDARPAARSTSLAGFRWLP